MYINIILFFNLWWALLIECLLCARNVLDIEAIDVHKPLPSWKLHSSEADYETTMTKIHKEIGSMFNSDKC